MVIHADFTFLHGLLDILPLVLDDSEASSAFWSLFARLLIRAPDLMNPPSLRKYACLLAERSLVIAEAVANHLEDADSCKKSSTSKKAAVSFYVGSYFFYLLFYIFTTSMLRKNQMGQSSRHAQSKLRTQFHIHTVKKRTITALIKIEQKI